MTNGARSPALTPLAILDLANAHATARAKAVYSFSKRDVIAFAQAVAAAAALPGEDTARLDALTRSAGFVTGSNAGEPAYRMFGSDQWNTDLRTVIDTHLVSLHTTDDSF